MSTRARVAALLLLVFASASIASRTFAASQASNDGEPLWKAECGSCHVAYPPRFLSADTWRRLMSGLDGHFGADATLDAKSVSAIGAYLEANAGRADPRRASPTLRISNTPWFQRKHHEVPANAWSRTAVRSASNCAACHTAAEQGDFRERNVRIPR